METNKCRPSSTPCETEHLEVSVSDAANCPQVLRSRKKPTMKMNLSCSPWGGEKKGKGSSNPKNCSQKCTQRHMGPSVGGGGDRGAACPIRRVTEKWRQLPSSQRPPSLCLLSAARTPSLHPFTEKVGRLSKVWLKNTAAKSRSHPQPSKVGPEGLLTKSRGDRAARGETVSAEQ